MLMTFKTTRLTEFTEDIDTDNLYLTSDWHLYHNNIISFCNRPYKNVDEMNSCLLDNYRNTVPKDAICFVLGDILFEPKIASFRVKDFGKIIKELPGRKFLIKGNHDHYSLTEYLDMGFEEVLTVIKGSNIKFHHRMDAYMYYQKYGLHYNDMPEGYKEIKELGIFEKCKNVHIIGHVHTIFKKLGKVVNCSVDVWDYKPIKFEVVMKELSNKDSLYVY